MSVYDTSPHAIAAYMANQQRCYNWAGETAMHSTEFKVPFGVRSDISSASTKLRLEPDEEDDIETGSLGVPDWERAEMQQLLTNSRRRAGPDWEQERGRHHLPATERPSKTRTHSHGHHHHSHSREVVEQPPPPLVKEKKSRSHSRHASSSSRRSRKTSNQTVVYAPPTATAQPQSGYPYAVHHQAVIPPPLPEPKRGFFSALFHRRRSISLPRQPPPFLQPPPPQQTRLSRSASFHRNHGEIIATHHSGSHSRSKSTDRRRAPVNNVYWSSRHSPGTTSTGSPSSSDNSMLLPHPHHPGRAPQYNIYGQPQLTQKQMGYLPPSQAGLGPTTIIPQRGNIAVARRGGIPSQWHHPTVQQQPQQMYARPQYSPYS